ncbi:MAG TPA: DUF1269 domain-containing protein [Streptosporangiaceae bacterium]|nr:DUF1269 domain-containing protein [Streptosporangiaceae bacterium]
MRPLGQRLAGRRADVVAARAGRRGAELGLPLHLASKITEDKFASAMQPFGGTILKTSLSESDEKELAEELTGQS